MREIKFRALTREGELIHDVGAIQFMTDGTIIVNDEIPIKQLIEFTGLKDKNGKEIYEGDILKYGKQWKPFELKWQENITGDGECHGYQVRSHDVEVIGNIYENPELLT